MNSLQEHLQKPQNQSLAKKLTILVWIVSAAVLFLVALMREVKIDLPEGVSLHLLPPFHLLLVHYNGLIFLRNRVLLYVN